MKDDPYLIQYMPDNPNDRLPERDFFFGVLDTLYKNETKELVYNARENRAINEETVQNDTVAINSEIMNELENIITMKSKHT